MNEPIWTRDAWALADEVRAGRLSATDLLEVCLERIGRLDPDLNAFCHLDEDGARRRAREIDSAVASGDDPGPLAGIPVAVKELAAVEGWPDTHGSLLYRDSRAAADGTEAARLRRAGAVLVGLTTSPEFGTLNWTNTYLHGVTRSPWNPDLTPGGSSGGSAAAVAAGMVPIATGSDGGGSIRIPASYCGLFGFKVSFGRVASSGAFDSSLTSVAGPMARSVRDAARYVDAVAGPTDIDPTSLPRPAVGYEEQLCSGAALDALRGLRVAWSSTLGFAACDPEVEHVARASADLLIAEAGLDEVELDIRFPKPGRAWGILSGLDMVAQHRDAAEGRLDEITPGARIGFEAIGQLTGDDVVRALRTRQELLDAVAAVFGRVDLLLTPTTATPAFVAEGPPPSEIAGRRVGGMGSVPFTAPFNISGQPAASIPAGLTVAGLPVGLQVVARRDREDLVLGAGRVVEQARPWPKLAPAARPST